MTDKTDTDAGANKPNKLLHSELTYKLRGIFFDIANKYGLGLKEKIYHQAFIDYLENQNLSFLHEKQVHIYSWKDGRKIGTYIPDFIISDTVVVEFKSEPFVTKHFINQAQSYLRVSSYEIALIVNFGADKLQINRFICTSDRKPQIKTNDLHQK